MHTLNQRSLVIRNGTLIDGSGGAPTNPDAIVIQGNRIDSVGSLPSDLELQDTKRVTVIDAKGQWIMPGLIEAHCHLSFGYPAVAAVRNRRGSWVLSLVRCVLRETRKRCFFLASPVYPYLAAVGL